MRKRYQYARVTRRLGEVEIIVGIEIKGGETAAQVYAATSAVLSDFSPELEAMPDDVLAQMVEERLGKRFDLKWRSYFLEIGRGALDEYVQVYQE